MSALADLAEEVGGDAALGALLEAMARAARDARVMLAHRPDPANLRAHLEAVATSAESLERALQDASDDAQTVLQPANFDREALFRLTLRARRAIKDSPPPRGRWAMGWRHGIAGDLKREFEKRGWAFTAYASASRDHNTASRAVRLLAAVCRATDDDISDDIARQIIGAVK